MSESTIQLPSGRVAVKICGVTNRTCALSAIEAGADLLGFNTWPGTKRFLDLERNSEWLSTLPADVVKVALLVNATPEDARKIAALPFIDALQLHGDEDADACARTAALGKPIIKAIRARDDSAFTGAATFSTPHLLLDAHVPGAFGGTGARVDIELVRSFQSRFPQLTLWLAGGLTAENVGAAIAAVRPSVVDVSSGIESEPGKKDFLKMQAFVKAARES